MDRAARPGEPRRRRLPARDAANIAAEPTTARAKVRPRNRNPLQCCRRFLIIAGVTGWRMKH